MDPHLTEDPKPSVCIDPSGARVSRVSIFFVRACGLFVWTVWVAMGGVAGLWSVACTTGCSQQAPVPSQLPQSTGETQTMKLELTSNAFGKMEKIPMRYTGDGEDVSPPLHWTGAPEEVAQWALICDDPDAPRPQPWVHWVIYGIDGKLDELPEALPTDATVTRPIGALQGENSWGKTGYGGPYPPPGHGLHHYHFTLYALSKPLEQPAGLTKEQLLQAMKGNILGKATLTGTYER